MGLAVWGGRLVALEPTPNGNCVEVAGALPVPRGKQGRQWIAVALRGNWALALDASGAVFELDVAAGSWSGPWQLKGGLDWRGICIPPSGKAWLSLGASAAGPELWHFERPASQPLFMQ